MRSRTMFYRFENVGAIGRPSGAGFGAYLSPSAAAAAAGATLCCDGQQRLVDACRRRITAVWPEDASASRYGLRIEFVDDSWLPRFFQVPGDAATLDLDWYNAEQAVRGTLTGDLHYGPHNVDHFSQAFGLIALFTGWAEMFEATVLLADTTSASASAASN